MRSEEDKQTFWQLGEKIGVSDKITKKELAEMREYFTEKDIRDIRHERLTRVTSRYFIQAERRIYWAGRGFFPRDDKIPD